MALIRFSQIVLIIVLIRSIPAHAQEIDPVHGKPGAFVVGMEMKMGGAQVDSKSRQAALAVADRILTLMRRDQAIAAPVGYSVRVHRAFGQRTDWAGFDSGLPFFAGVAGTFFGAGEKPAPNAFQGPDFGIYANTVLQCPVNTFTPPGAEHPWRVDGNPVIQGGHPTGEFQGHAVYDDHCIVLSLHKKSPFVPLTREQYIGLETTALQQRLEYVKQRFAGQSDPNIRAALESAVQPLSDEINQRQQELNSMDAAARSSQAFVKLEYQHAKLVEPGADGAVPLSIPNPAFFNSSLPPTTVQAISVFIPYLQLGPPPEGLPSGLPDEWRPAVEKIRDQLDWAGLEALLQ